MTDERVERAALARFATSDQLDPEMQQKLEMRGWVQSIPAITFTGRKVLENDGTVPSEWARDD